MERYRQRVRRYFTLVCLGFLVSSAHLFFLNPDQSHNITSLALILLGTFTASFAMFRMARCYPDPVPPPYLHTTAEDTLIYSGMFIMLVGIGLLRGETPWKTAPFWLIVAGMATSFGVGCYAMFVKKPSAQPIPEKRG